MESISIAAFILDSLVLPAASRPSMSMRISLLPKRRWTVMLHDTKRSMSARCLHFLLLPSLMLSGQVHSCVLGPCKTMHRADERDSHILVAALPILSYSLLPYDVLVILVYVPVFDTGFVLRLCSNPPLCASVQHFEEWT